MAVWDFAEADACSAVAAPFLALAVGPGDSDVADVDDAEDDRRRKYTYIELNDSKCTTLDRDDRLC